MLPMVISQVVASLSHCPITLADAPSAINTVENPSTNKTEAASALRCTARSVSASLVRSSSEVPAIKHR